jgi:hypothetical protein
MSPWRARARRVIFKRRVPLTIGQYALEMGLVVWSATIGVNILTGLSPSVSLQSLPDALEFVWAALMIIAGVTVSFGIWSHRLGSIASGMYLFATTLVAFAAAVIGASTWGRSGATAGFFLAVGCVCLLRGWWLKEQEAELIKEIVRTRREDC